MKSNRTYLIATLSSLFAGVILFTSLVSASTLFEGWFEIYVGAKKIGYLTERYEFTSDSKFKCTYYIKTELDGNTTTESLKAFSSSSLAPISYAYTSKAGEDIKVVDATFKGEQMTLKINDGKSEHKETKQIKKGTFLSTFLLYLIMGNEKAGLKLTNNYMYSAIAEEEGVAYNGQALVSSKEKVKGQDTFKVLNKFKTGTKNEERFFTWVTPKGEVVLTRSPDKNVDVRSVATQAEATKGLMVNLKDLKLLFGKIPGESVGASEAAATGEDKKTTPPKPAATPGPVKGAGEPSGQGIEIKGVPPPKNQ
jgi:uncharacterized protein Veg